MLTISTAVADVVAHICNPTYSGSSSWRITSSRLVQAKIVRLCQNQNKNKRAGGIPQGVKYLPSMYKVLGSFSKTKGKIALQ
jgi:hypothetical protein